MECALDLDLGRLKLLKRKEKMVIALTRRPYLTPASRIQIAAVTACTATRPCVWQVDLGRLRTLKKKPKMRTAMSQL